MFNSKYNNLLTVLLIIAIIAIIGILGFLGYSMINKYYINAEAREIVDAFEQTHVKDTNTVAVPEQNVVDGNMTIGEMGESNSIYNGNTGSGNGKVTYNGYDVIGTISIPSINIEYPILEKVTTKALKLGVAYLSGPGINKVRKYCNTRT